MGVHMYYKRMAVGLADQENALSELWRLAKEASVHVTPQV